MIVFLGIALALLILVIVIWMLVARRIREKYAALWLIIGAAVFIVGLFPQLLIWLTGVLGVQLPSNLLFAFAIVLLLGVALHLSWELSHAEEEIRRLAEESAIARADIDALRADIARLESTRSASDPPESPAPDASDAGN